MTTAPGDGHGATSMLDAAYQQLADLGPLVDARSVTLSGVAKALGMSRSQLYRRWETSADMALDIARFRATPDTGWHAEVCADDGTPLAGALRRSLTSPHSADGVLTRASVSTWRDSSAHRGLAAWERRHLARLAERLRREWGPEVRGPWTDIAIALTAFIEGMHLMCAQVAEEPGQAMPADLIEEVAQQAVRIVDFLLTEAEGGDTPLRDPDDEAEESSSPASLPARLADALTEGTLHLPSDGGRRVIDMGVLARARGVSERSLYSRWPAPADLHADLYLESIARAHAAFTRVIVDVFRSNVSGPYANTMPLIALMNSWFMDPDRFPEASIHLGITDVLSEQVVLDRVRRPVQEFLQAADMQTAALLQASGYRLRIDVRVRTYTMFITGMGMGSHRTSATHPEILQRRLRYLGEEYLAAGIGHTAMTRSSTELVDATGRSAGADPPVPAALRSARG